VSSDQKGRETTLNEFIEELGVTLENMSLDALNVQVKGKRLFSLSLSLS
jgi:hypothetical protein